MKKFYVAFSGYCEVEAENDVEAERIFREQLPAFGENDVWDIDEVEEKWD